MTSGDAAHSAKKNIVVYIHKDSGIDTRRTFGFTTIIIHLPSRGFLGGLSLYLCFLGPLGPLSPSDRIHVGGDQGHYVWLVVVRQNACEPTHRMSERILNERDRIFYLLRPSLPFLSLPRSSSSLSYFSPSSSLPPPSIAPPSLSSSLLYIPEMHC